MSDDRYSRRRVLGLLGAGALAGCSGGPSTDAQTAADDPTVGTDAETSTPGGGTEPRPTADGTTESAGTPVATPQPPGSGGSWSIPGYDALNTGYNPDAVGPGGAVDRVWGTNVDGIYTMAQVAVRDGRVFTASGEAAYAMDAASGETLWRTEIAYLGHHYPVAATGDTAYVPARTLSGSTQGGGSGTVYALDVETGAERWKHATPVTTAAVPVDDTLYYGASTGDRSWVVARSTADGSERWRHDLAETAGNVAAFGEPAISDGRVLSTATTNGGAGYDTGGLAFALDRDTGERLWEQSFGGGMVAGPTIGGDRAYVATLDGGLAALSVADGSVLWERTLDGDVYSTPVTDGDLLVALSEGTLVGVDAASGSVRWRTDVGVILINGLALTESTVYVGGKEVRAARRSDGEIQWRYPIPGAGGGFGGPVVTGETVFVGACVKDEPTSMYDDSVYALQRARE